LKNLTPIIGPLLTFIEEWLRPATKEQVRQALTQFELQIKDQDHWQVLKAPLGLISSLADRFIDSRLLSKKGFIRFSRYQLILLITSLFVIGISTGRPFTLSPGPWEAYTASLWFCQSAVTTARTAPNLKDNPATLDAIKVYKSISRVMRRTWAKVGYIILFFVLILFLVFCLGYFVLALTRKMLRQLLAADPLTMIYVILGYVQFTTLLTTFFIVVLGLYLLPVVWAGIPIAVGLSSQSSLIAIGIALVASVLGWMFLPGSLKAISILTFFPALLLIFLLLLLVVLYPFRRYIHKFIVAFCRRSIEHEKGPLVLLFRILAVLVVLIVLLTIW
jgi:hypothetical protein